MARKPETNISSHGPFRILEKTRYHSGHRRRRYRMVAQPWIELKSCEYGNFETLAYTMTSICVTLGNKEGLLSCVHPSSKWWEEVPRSIERSSKATLIWNPKLHEPKSLLPSCKCDSKEIRTKRKYKSKSKPRSKAKSNPNLCVDEEE